jgi:hypothetical protein
MVAGEPASDGTFLLYGRELSTIRRADDHRTPAAHLALWLQQCWQERFIASITVLVQRERESTGWLHTHWFRERKGVEQRGAAGREKRRAGPGDLRRLRPSEGSRTGASGCARRPGCRCHQDARGSSCRRARRCARASSSLRSRSRQMSRSRPASLSLGVTKPMALWSRTAL